MSHLAPNTFYIPLIAEDFVHRHPELFKDARTLDEAQDILLAAANATHTRLVAGKLPSLHTQLKGHKLFFEVYRSVADFPREDYERLVGIDVRDGLTAETEQDRKAQAERARELALDVHGHFRYGPTALDYRQAGLIAFMVTGTAPDEVLGYLLETRAPERFRAGRAAAQEEERRRQLRVNPATRSTLRGFIAALTGL